MIEATTLAEVWDEHIDRLLLIARSMGDPAEDAVQEAFVSLAKQDHLPDDPLAWLARVARNHLMQWTRSRRRRQRRETSVVKSNWFEVDIRRIQQQIDGVEVTRALLRLASPQREVIVMHLWGEMTFEAIGRVIDLPRASAHRAYQDGLRELKSKYDNEPFDGVMKLCP